jgi:hypothetical protein
MNKLPLVCFVLAVIAAIFYFQMALGVVHPGSLQTKDAPMGIVYTAAAGYLVGGFLVFTQKRWILIVGAILNALVMTIFFAAYYQKPDIMFSLPGLGTKIPQILFEIGLIALIMRRKSGMAQVQGVMGD